MTVWHVLRLHSSRDGLKRIFYDIRSQIDVVILQVQVNSCRRLPDGRT
jgi:hypothetical protein